MGRTLTGLALALGLFVATTAGVQAQTIPLSPLKFSDRTLANGLRVLLVEDHSSPTVAINIGYKVGGKDDPPGRSGFAHLFEHLMFKGTANTKPETIDRLTEDVGGLNNAFTAEDLTNYYEVVPSNYLQTLLWAEADRLASLNIDDANFKTERKVVIGEYDQSVLAAPYGRLSELIDRETFSVHPYRRGVIGNPDELNASTLDDVQRFHATYYRPENATLVVAGDFDPAQANAWIDQYFGRIPRKSDTIPRVSVVEPQQQTQKRYTYYGANVPLPAVAFVYRATSAAAADAPVLRVIETLLADGESARLYRSLVYDEQLASAVAASADLREQPGVFTLYAILNGGRKPEAAEGSLDREIRKLQSQPVGAAELEKAKTQLASALVRDREENNDVAVELVRAAVVKGDPNRVNSELAEIQAVTPEDVRRVARTYLVPTNRTVIYYLPTAMKPPGKKENR